MVLSILRVTGAIIDMRSLRFFLSTNRVIRRGRKTCRFSSTRAVNVSYQTLYADYRHRSMSGDVTPAVVFSYILR